MDTLTALAVAAAACCAGGWLAERARLPVATGYLLIGVLLGPTLSLVPVLNDPESPAAADLQGLSGFFALLLVGVAGTALDFDLVRRRSRPVATTSAGSLLLPLVVTAVAALWAPQQLRGPVGNDVLFVVFAALVVSVSAIPVIAKILDDLGLLHREVGQLAVGVAVVDDAVVWVGLAVITATLGRSPSWAPATLLWLLPAMVVLALLCRACRAPDGPGGDSGLLAVAWFAVAGLATSALGLDYQLGAFVAGAVLANSRLVDVVGLARLRRVTLGVLAALYLTFTGMRADLRPLADPGLAAAAVVVVVLAVATKVCGGYLGARWGGLDQLDSLAVASAVTARGTVQLIVASAGLQLGLISADGFTVVVVMSLVTSAVAGVLLRRAARPQVG